MFVAAAACGARRAALSSSFVVVVVLVCAVVVRSNLWNIVMMERVAELMKCAGPRRAYSIRVLVNFRPFLRCLWVVRRKNEHSTLIHSRGLECTSKKWFVAWAFAGLDFTWARIYESIKLRQPIWICRWLRNLNDNVAATFILLSRPERNGVLANTSHDKPKWYRKIRYR